MVKPYVTIHESTKSHTLRPEIFKEGLYHDCGDEITQMARVILGHEPIESGMARLDLSEETYEQVPRYYIECTDDRAVTPHIQQKRYQETPCEKVYKIESSHSPFFSKPGELVNIILEIAGLAI